MTIKQICLGTRFTLQNAALGNKMKHKLSFKTIRARICIELALEIDEIFFANAKQQQNIPNR